MPFRTMPFRVMPFRVIPFSVIPLCVMPSRLMPFSAIPFRWCLPAWFLFARCLYGNACQRDSFSRDAFSSGLSVRCLFAERLFVESACCHSVLDWLYLYAKQCSHVVRAAACTKTSFSQPNFHQERKAHSLLQFSFGIAAMRWSDRILSFPVICNSLCYSRPPRRGWLYAHL